MAQAKHTFVESKMNKDLDDRLLSGGQYRNAINIAVSKSEDSDVGALENVLGNFNISNYFPIDYIVPEGLIIIGLYFNNVSDDIFVFLTNYTESNNPDSVPFKQEYAPSSAQCFINKFNVKNNIAQILVQGAFLNFAQNYPVLGIDIAENYLFFTDNRNQPRKINITRASQDSNYYNNEDTISVAKYNPFQVINLSQETIMNEDVVVTDAATLEVDLYNSVTQSYSTQNVIPALSVGDSPYSKIVLSNSNLDNIPLYTYFTLTAQSGAVSQIYQIYAKEGNVNNSFYTWPKINPGTYVSIRFYQANIIDTVNKYLPTSARIEISNGQANTGYVTGGSYTAYGPGDNATNQNPPVNGELFYRPGGPGVQHLNGGNDNDDIPGYPAVGEEPTLPAGYEWIYGFPLGMFGPLYSKQSSELPEGDLAYTGVTDSDRIAAPSDFNTTTGLQIDGEWVPTLMTSNIFNNATEITNNNIKIAFYNRNDGTDQLNIKANYGLPNQQTTSAPNVWWNFAFDKTVNLSAGKSYLSFQFPNPYYKANWAGDKNNLEDKFVRFAYRFKFDDDEYSLVSPFTQPVFIPRQDGYFINENPNFSRGISSELIDQVEKTGEDTVVSFFRNKGKEFKIDIPFEFPVNQLSEKLKIKEIDIIYKESDGVALKIIESVDVTSTNLEVSNNSTNILQYVYQSGKPFKTLDPDAITRTSDKVPVRALAQASSGNRIMYANFVDKHTSPLNLDYEVATSPKLQPRDSGSSNSIFSYPNHTVKQGRTYQVGVILQDRYGRETDVILTPPKNELRVIDLGDGQTLEFGDSTIYSKYKQEAFGDETLEWKGDSLKILFNSTIPTTLTDRDGYPGLWNGSVGTSDYNPLGFYTYKIVVKQKEQDYYNVYLPSLLVGQPKPAPIEVSWNSGGPTACNDRVIGTGSQLMNGLDTTAGLRVGLSVILKYSGGGSQLLYKGTIQEIISDSEVLLSPAAPATIYGGGWGVGGECVVGSPQAYTNPIVYFFENAALGNRPYLPQTMTTTLTGDNINKVPADLTEIRPNQEVYRTSDLELIPRVASNNNDTLLNQLPTQTVGDEFICSTNFSGQVYPGTERDVISILGNWNDVVPEGEYGTGLYDENRNPTVIITSNKQQIGSTANQLQKFSVLETAPVVSNLDIFWETSTSGLISDLNADILEGDDPVEIAIDDAFNQIESTNYSDIPSEVLSVIFKDQGNQVITSLASVNIVSVLDGFGTDHKSEYQMGNVNGGSYSIEAVSDVVFLADDRSNTRLFTFQAVSSGYATFNFTLPSVVRVINAAPIMQNTTSSYLNCTNPSQDPYTLGLCWQTNSTPPSYLREFPLSNPDPVKFDDFVMDLTVNPSKAYLLPFVPNNTIPPYSFKIKNGTAKQVFIGPTTSATGPNEYSEVDCSIACMTYTGGTSGGNDPSNYTLFDNTNPSAGFFLYRIPGQGAGAIYANGPFPQHYKIGFDPLGNGQSILNNPSFPLNVYLKIVCKDADTNLNATGTGFVGAYPGDPASNITVGSPSLTGITNASQLQTEDFSNNVDFIYVKVTIQNPTAPPPNPGDSNQSSYYANWTECKGGSTAQGSSAQPGAYGGTDLMPPIFYNPYYGPGSNGVSPPQSYGQLNNVTTVGNPNYISFGVQNYLAYDGMVGYIFMEGYCGAG